VSLRAFPGLRLFLWVVLAAVLSACTSGSSSPDPAPDTTATAPDTTTAAPASPDPPPEAPSEAEADARSVSQKLTDTSTEARVKQALIQTERLRVFSFRPTVVNGHLVLRGDVNTVDQYREAGRIAGQVEGVEAVSNELTAGGRPVTEDRLSGADSSSTDDAAAYHTVRQGDNLWDIARKYQVSVEQIRRLNDVQSSSALRPGQRIRVR